MAAIDFPNNPTVGQQFVVGNETWTWDGVKWTAFPGTMSVPDAPQDGQLYGRQLVTGNMRWAVASSGGGLVDAPSDGTLYGRRSAGWSHATHNDITDWAASVPVATTITPKVDGTAAIGTDTGWAKGDHVHPTDTSRYAASNPSGYQTAAQVTASLAPYALTTSVPFASVVLPFVDGTATIGLTGTWADGGHIHPTDTSRYAASNPSGYQTASQVTTAIASAVPTPSATTPLVDGTAAIGSLTTSYALADHVHPIGAGSKWTQLATANTVAGSATVTVTGLSQIYSDLLIVGSSLGISTTTPIIMLVSTNNGSTFSSASLALAGSTNSASFVAMFHGYSSGIGQTISTYVTSALPASPGALAASTITGGITTHTGGCNALRFQVNSGVFNTSTGSFTIYGR